MQSKKTLKIIILAFLSAILFNNCKKGEDDPAFSLRTRKARVVGDWHIESGSISYTSLQAGKAPYSTRWSFTNSQSSRTETYGGGTPVIYTSVYLLNVSFKKDGKFDMSETFAGKTSKLSGRWNFVYGIGETKKKEAIIIVLDVAASGGTDYGLFNKFGTELMYTIKELRNKKMVLDVANKLYADADGSYTSYGSTFNLIQ